MKYQYSGESHPTLTVLSAYRPQCLPTLDIRNEDAEARTSEDNCEVVVCVIAVTDYSGEAFSL